jgi:hypothetical protein
MSDNQATNRKRTALAMALRKRSRFPRDKSTPGAVGDAKAFNRWEKGWDVLRINEKSSPDPTRKIDKKTKVQYGKDFEK